MAAAGAPPPSSGRPRVALVVGQDDSELLAKNAAFRVQAGSYARDE
jgi:hypothetical protein